MKRLMDVTLAVFAVLLLGPVMLGATLAIWLESGRPILFSQTRVGLQGRRFRMLKFRSMVHHAATLGPYYTTDQDARITRVGRVIRKTSIDELPQLWNVLVGDMSLVGPRPDVPEQQSLYSEGDWTLRCSVKPGLTGLAQALIRSVGTADERLSLDLRYVREGSIWLDVKILFWTLGRLSGKGAN